MNRIIILFMSVVLLSSCSEAQVKSDKHQTNQVINKVLSAEEFKAKTLEKGIQLIDVRTPEEFNDGIIGNAVNMNFYDADFEAMIGSLDKHKPTLVYCAAGGRSGKAAKKMQAMGFTEVYDLKGGYGNWPYKK